MFARTQLLTELVPRLSRVGVIRQADREVGGFAELETTARRLNVRSMSSTSQRRRTRGCVRHDDWQGVGAVIIAGRCSTYAGNRSRDLALKHRLPAIHVLKEYAKQGC
jgi:hypothetical protein